MVLPWFFDSFVGTLLSLRLWVFLGVFFRDFFTHGPFQRSLTTTFLVLIPKKGGAKDLKDLQTY